MTTHKHSDAIDAIVNSYCSTKVHCMAIYLIREAHPGLNKEQFLDIYKEKFGGENIDLNDRYFLKSWEIYQGPEDI